MGRTVSVALLALLILVTFPSFPVCSTDLQPGTDFDTAAPLDLSSGFVTVNGSLTKLFEDDHFYAITGLSSGMRVSVTGVLKGIESGLTTLSMYSENRARLGGVDQVVGKNVERKVELKYLLAYDPKNPEPLLFVRVGKSSGAALNYTLRITVEKLFDAGSNRDAGGDIQSALTTTTVSIDSPLSFRGYLSSEELGNDYSDYYKLGVVLQPKDEIFVEVDPGPNLMVWATLLTPDGFSLRHNKSEIKGEPVTLRVRGDWSPGLQTFYLRVENLGGSGGDGEYTVGIQVLRTASVVTATPASPTQPWPILDQETMKYIIMGTAVAIVAVAVTILLVRRRRTVREYEWGGWDTGSWGEGEW